jgi:drug/metabolite transporter (DMT)-like permease
MALPISYPEFSQVNWTALPYEAVWRFAFVVIGTTFMTYLLNVYALKQLKASTVGVFTYLQPLIGIAYAIMVGADGLTASKLGTGSVVLLGVYLVTRQYESKI